MKAISIRGKWLYSVHPTHLTRVATSRYSHYSGAGDLGVFKPKFFDLETLTPLRTPQAELKFPMDYPYSPPRLRFLTPILHPNVYPVSPGVFVVIGNGFCSLVYIYYYYLKLRRTASSVYLFFIPQAKTLTAENCRLSVGIQHRVSGSFLSLLLLLL